MSLLQYINKSVDIDDYGNDLECPNCDHHWELDPEDDRPLFCHVCGWDEELMRVDIVGLSKWKRMNEMVTNVFNTVDKKLL